VSTSDPANLEQIKCDILPSIGVGVTKIMGSGIDDWVYWHFFAVTINFYSSHIELVPNNICMTILSLISHYSRTDLYNSLIHESTAFYNCHVVRIDATLSNTSSVLWVSREFLCYYSLPQKQIFI
jgi:hypothetical protein